MELQHCIACSDVMVAPQSYANVASPTTSNARKIVLPNSMFVYVSRPGYSSQAQGHSKTANEWGVRQGGETLQEVAEKLIIASEKNFRG